MLCRDNEGLLIPTETYNAGNPDAIADLVSRAVTLDMYELWNLSAQAQTPVPAGIVINTDWYGNQVISGEPNAAPNQPSAVAEGAPYQFYGTGPSGETVAPVAPCSSFQLTKILASSFQLTKILARPCRHLQLKHL